MNQTVGKIKIRSVEEHLNLFSNSVISEDLIIKETILSVEYLFKVDFRDIIFNHSNESYFMRYCVIRYLAYDKGVFPENIIPIFKDKFSSRREIMKVIQDRKSTHYEMKYNNVREQLDNRLNELIN